MYKVGDETPILTGPLNLDEELSTLMETYSMSNYSGDYF